MSIQVIVILYLIIGIIASILMEIFDEDTKKQGYFVIDAESIVYFIICTALWIIVIFFWLFDVIKEKYFTNGRIVVHFKKQEPKCVFEKFEKCKSRCSSYIAEDTKTAKNIMLTYNEIINNTTDQFLLDTKKII